MSASVSSCAARQLVQECPLVIHISGTDGTHLISLKTLDRCGHVPQLSYARPLRFPTGLQVCMQTASRMYRGTR